MTDFDHPEWACAAALAALPLQTPHRLRRLIESDVASSWWNKIQCGGSAPLGIDTKVWSAWQSASPTLPAEMRTRCESGSISVTTIVDHGYPASLSGDRHAPSVLFHRGNIAALDQRRVGIIGTRSATQAGRFFARTLAAQLAENSVCVVSGLARGIDVESHIGALSRRTDGGAQPAGVVASGLDVVYPPEHAVIWETMGNEALLISENPPGTNPEPHRFPMRNRILAALSEVLVVVESRATGGSMITVREAMNRDVTVLAVPGSPSLESSAGTNGLLRDGCAPVTDVDDVLIALGLDSRRTTGWLETRMQPIDSERTVLDAMGREPVGMDSLALRTSMSVVDVAVSLGRLEAKGWVACSNGWWEALIR